MTDTAKRFYQIQHKVRPEVKRWIEARAKELDRPQVWLVNRIVEDAYAQAQKEREAQS